MQRRYSRTVVATAFSVALLLVSFGDLRFGENVAIGDSECNDTGGRCARSDFDCPGPQAPLAQRSDYVVFALPVFPVDSTPNPSSSRYERVNVAVDSVVDFDLSVVPDPQEFLAPDDSIEFAGVPTVTSSDPSVFRILEVTDKSLQIEVLAAGDAELLIEWEGASGSHAIAAVEPTQYNVFFDDMQLVGLTALVCTQSSNGRSAATPYHVLSGDEFVFTVYARSQTGALFGQPQVPLFVDGFNRDLNEPTSFSETLTADSDGRYSYSIPSDATGTMLRFSSGDTPHGAVRYFSVVPGADQLAINVGPTDSCSPEGPDSLVCSYVDRLGAATVMNFIGVTPTSEGTCIDKSNRCDVALQISVDTQAAAGSANITAADSATVTIDNPCLPDGVATCSTDRPCDVTVDGLFTLEFSSGAGVSAVVTYAGVSRELRFEPEAAE